MSEFTFKEEDHEGKEALEVIAAADKFNQWMFDVIKPYCQGKILEIGSGIGNISQFFIKNNYSIVLSDIRTNYCEKLQESFNNYNNVLGVVKMDLTDSDFDNQFKDYLNAFDTVLYLNVLEHIQDDNLAVHNSRKLLKDGGKLIILVPAYNFLYSRFDKELEHYRRYNKKRLKAIFTNQNFTVIHAQYFNFIGTLGWFFTGKVLRKKNIPEGQMGLYNKLVPVFKIVDRILFNQVGLSVIVVGEK